MTEPQTLKFIIVHNSNPIFLALSLLFQTTESVDIKSSTLLCPNQSQTINNSEFIVYSRKKKS